MDISEQLTQQKFEQILMNIYLLENVNDQLTVIDIIEEIKQQILAGANTHT